MDTASSTPLQPDSDVTPAAGNQETDVTELYQGGEAKMDESAAATKIQASYRGFRARKDIKAANQAASKIQAGFRGYKVRKQLRDGCSESNMNGPQESSAGAEDMSSNELEQQSAIKIQAGVRGYLERKKLQAERDAAVKIQAGFRGYKARQEVKHMIQEQAK